MKFNRTRFATRTALALAVSGVFAVSPAIAPVAAYATSSKDLQKQLDQANADLAELQKTLDQANAELGKTTYDLDQTKTKIADLEKQIAKNEKKLEKEQAQLSTHASSSYKQGNANLVSIVLDSGNFSELVNHVFYANVIAKDEQEQIKTVSELQKSLSNDKADLEKQKTEQEKLVKSRQAEAAAADAAAAKQSSYVNQLSDEVKAAMEAERQKQAEESRKAAEEAMREQAEEDQTNQNDDAGDDSGGNGGGTTDNGGNGNGSNQQKPSKPSGNGGSGSTGKPSKPSGNGGSGSNASSSQRQTAINAAIAQVGKPYSHANNTSSGFDCNGLTNYAWACAGVSIPYASGHYGYGQFQWMKSSGRWVTSVSSLRPGDLVFYSYDGGYTTYHVALYIGGGQIVHAIGYSQGIQVTPLSWVSGFCGGGSPI